LPDLQIDDDTIRATANLPGLTIEVMHRRLPNADAEQISINMQAVPSFAVFGRYLDGINPFAVWAQLAQAAWLPWLGPWVGALTHVGTEAAASPPREPGQPKQISPSDGRAAPNRA
jgi:hypothetical protein